MLDINRKTLEDRGQYVIHLRAGESISEVSLARASRSWADFASRCELVLKVKGDEPLKRPYLIADSFNGSEIQAMSLHYDGRVYTLSAKDFAGKVAFLVEDISAPDQEKRLISRTIGALLPTGSLVTKTLTLANGFETTRIIEVENG